MIFTTHKRSAISYLNRGIVDYRAGEPEVIIEEFKRTGYYYKNKPDNPGNSGIAFYSPSRMFGTIEKFPELKVNMLFGGWMEKSSGCNYLHERRLDLCLNRLI